MYLDKEISGSMPFFLGGMPFFVVDELLPADKAQLLPPCSFSVFLLSVWQGEALKIFAIKGGRANSNTYSFFVVLKNGSRGKNGDTYVVHKRKKV